MCSISVWHLHIDQEKFYESTESFEEASAKTKRLIRPEKL
jgi:hypothetical protein